MLKLVDGYVRVSDLVEFGGEDFVCSVLGDDESDDEGEDGHGGFGRDDFFGVERYQSEESEFGRCQLTPHGDGIA